MTNFLNPEPPALDAGDVVTRYRQRVWAALLPQQSCHTEAVVLGLPSFEREWAVWLHGTVRGEFHLSLSIADESIWESTSQSEDAETAVTVSRWTCEVSVEFRSLLVDVFGNALRTVSNANSGPMGLDGVSYHFFAQGLWGWTWSPHPATMCGRLVSVAKKLREFIQSGNSKPRTMAVIEAALRQVDAPPSRRCDDKATARAITNIRAAIDAFVSGMISATELSRHMHSAWDELGYPRFGEVVRLVESLPENVRRLLRDS